MKRLGIAAVLLLLTVTTCLQAAAAEKGLRPDDYVAVIGDSITEQRLYSMFIEDYLLMCKPVAGLRVTQFGWGGETAPGFAGRMANDMLRFQATVATTCFGMNDGGYSPMDPAKEQRYRDGQKSIVAQLKKAGVRLIVVGSPSCVDADTFAGHNPKQATMYNKTLAQLRDVAKSVAHEEGVVYADVFDPMMEVMTKAKAKYGKDYHVAGPDGVHPDCNGHLVMAYAFLKALGCDGNIGTVTVDLAGNKAEATEGHKVLSCKDGQVEIESAKYPFCFYGDPAQPSATRGVIEFFPFNDDLNRFQLVVTNLGADKAKVTWGKATKEFTAAQLAKGINLAAEFLDNPFAEPFRKVQEQIRRQQEMEVGLIKTLIHDLPGYKSALPGEEKTLERFATALVERDREARNASAAAVTPVQHTIKIEAVK
ncbi:MAG: SGNH/GDSL hydrolase family protein [Planctomycetaceae bacterium]|nr:SGNH/GDSL hydrolase family protein [Planctomycetaceae bacterium]